MFATSLGITQLQFDEIVGAFKRYDSSNDGFMDIRELEDCLRLLGQKPTRAEMLMFMAGLDADQSGTVDFNEFLPFMSELLKQDAKFQPAGEGASLLAQPKSVGSRRRVVNWIPFIIGVALPWFVFALLFSLNSFRAAYLAPSFVGIFNVLCLVGALLYVYRERKGKTVSVPYFIGWMCLGSVVAGWLLGNLNFWNNMHSFYELNQMATYVAVNPSRLHMAVATTTGSSVNYQDAITPRPTEGKRYQDAGKVFFGGLDIGVDVRKTMSFKNEDTFCVAPIVDLSCEFDCGYDFWAVGINCCGSDDQLTFTCNGLGSPAADHRQSAKSAVRWVEEGSKPYFRLAVVEAEGVHHIKSTHPIFFTFYNNGEDPDASVGLYAQTGYANLFAAVLLQMGINIALMLLVAKRVVTTPRY